MPIVSREASPLRAASVFAFALWAGGASWPDIAPAGVRTATVSARLDWCSFLHNDEIDAVVLAGNTAGLWEYWL